MRFLLFFVVLAVTFFGNSWSRDFGNVFTFFPGIGFHNVRQALQRSAEPAVAQVPAYEVGFKGYVPLSVVKPLQWVVSYFGVGTTIYLNGGHKAELLPLDHDEGRAARSLNEAKKAVLGPNGEVRLLDGHHSFIASSISGATTFPVSIVADYRGLSDAAFIRTLHDQKLSFLMDLETGELSTTLPGSFADLEDSHFRDWVDRSSLDVTTYKGNWEARCETPTPAWIRDDQDLPVFGENRVARILIDEGLTPDQYPECFQPACSLPASVNETIRAFMIRAEKNGRFADLPGVKAIHSPSDFRDMDLRGILGTDRVFEAYVFTLPVQG